MKPFRTLLYYKYAVIKDADVFSQQHLDFCKYLGIKGRILIADEGINGTLSGSLVQTHEYKLYMQRHPFFSGIEFKEDWVEQNSFDKLYVRYRPELVSLKAEDQVDPKQSNVPHLSAKEVRALKDQDDVVMLDVRNQVEFEIGKFKDAVTLPMDTFREFPGLIDQLESLKEKKIIAYCTGGIRCEKATMLLKNRGFENVYQIDGGIHKYGQEAGGEDFEGKMYVFDKRLAVDVNSTNPNIISSCKICQKASARVVNCANAACNEHFVLCQECGWKMQGCCSTNCMQVDDKRPYNGTGYYSKGAVEH